MKQLLLIITTVIITIFGITSCSIVDNVPLSTISVDGKPDNIIFTNQQNYKQELHYL
ncbi:MAG: hypothetical protein IPL21_10985 [Saprospirales bacterium]|nr:hypothetical protein [Saprospirales bacterium]